MSSLNTLAGTHLENCPGDNLGYCLKQRNCGCGCFDDDADSEGDEEEVLFHSVECPHRDCGDEMSICALKPSHCTPVPCPNFKICRCRLPL
ncbi:MAG: hypothetical protein Sylvanvirus35_8 [Sylvanvirus sp.]|uniref:Uncharacterized protein n=1 Tax=Sylvanvirus sp. TaxID=2487774 RepID=A0A3G5AJ53_9VIRU|nr:MAG: hypothetical protein Sylvanvirus35_8 [Sylvanvirus sp.]